jgi:hypothetical protein
MRPNDALKVIEPPKALTDSENPDEIRAEIEIAREQVVASARALRKEVSARVDWREWVRRNPLAWVGGAFVVGWLLSGHRR